MGMFGFVGPTGAGKNTTEMAWTLDAALQAEDAGIHNYAIYSNYRIFNGDGDTDHPTDFPNLHPIEDIAQIPELNYCQMNLTELPLSLGADPRMNANRQSLFATRACANLRKKHVGFLFDAKDPESEVDKRIRFSTEQWIAPQYSPQYDLILQAVFTRTKTFMQAYDDDTILSDAEALIPILNVSRFFPYFDTDQTFENFRQPYPLTKTAEDFRKWLHTNARTATTLTLAEFLVETNQDPPTPLQKTALLSRTQYLQRSIPYRPEPVT